jgi:glycosyltransferase involved in cell wall biosynthesis
VRGLVITNLYPPQALGGYELSCQDVVRRWQAGGHSVTVVTTTTRLRDDAVTGGGAADTGAADADVHRVLEWYWADHELQRPAPRDRLRIERANRRRLADLLDATKPDVVSVWAMGCMSMSVVSLCLERRLPMVAVVGDDWLRYGPAADGWLAAWSRRPRAIGRLAARLSGVPTRPPELPSSVTVGFVSEFIRDRARSADAVDAVGFTTSEIVPPGIDPTDFPPRRAEPRPWGGRLICVGRVEPRKGFDVAVRALAELDGTTLQIVGPGDGHLGELLDLARDIGVADRVVPADPVPRSQLAPLYADADALVFPSRWEEPFGLVPLEAMSQSTPVIATRRGGSAEFLVDGTNCLEVAVDDPAGVAAAVRRLADDAALRDRLVRAGGETAARYDVDSYADRLEALHLSAIRAGR